jgi:hypothetical protein
LKDVVDFKEKIAQGKIKAESFTDKYVPDIVRKTASFLKSILSNVVQQLLQEQPLFLVHLV